MAGATKSKTEAKEAETPLSKEMAVLKAMAKAAQDRRKTVSASVRSTERRESYRNRLIKQYVGEDALRGGKNGRPLVEAIFIEDTPHNRKRHAANGAEPVLHEGQPVHTNGGDLLMVRPYEYRVEELADARQQSKDRLNNKSMFQEDGEEVRSSGFEEETEIARDLDPKAFSEAFDGS
jgi:hypothetical protein